MDVIVNTELLHFVMQQILMEMGLVCPLLSPISSFPETRKTDRDRCHLWGNFLSSTIMFSPGGGEVSLLLKTALI